MGTLPTRFEDLSVAELRRSAIEDFAVDVGEADSKKSVMAALLESGITWGDYVAQHPEVAPEEDEPVATIKETVTEVTVPVSTQEVAEPTIVFKEEPVIQQNAQYLIRMTRDNPLYEVRGYRFTDKHPYALVQAKDAQYILSHEDGFRQAFPDEISEFYS